MAVRIKPLTAGWILALFYAVGFAGFQFTQTSGLMRQLVWVTLLLTLLVLLGYHKKWTGEFVFSMLLIACAGFMLEVAGVKTGWIFGHYVYGPTLGIMVWDTPLMMGVNWFLTVYICRQISEQIVKDAFLVAVVAAGLMVLLDLFLEPFAIATGMWSWNAGKVPMHNYIGWFVSGTIIQYAYIRSVKLQYNKLSLPVYLVQLAFFAGLYFLAAR